MAGAELKVADLQVKFGSEPVLAVPSLAVSSGALVVLTGPSGSGKTTLLHTLAGILRPTTGTVTWDAVVLSGLSQSKADSWRRLNCGLVFQDFHLIEQLTPLQNALLPATFAHFATPAPVKARAAALLKEFGVPEAARSVTTLSRGERQRVAIARALLMDPSIVLADEPTASLDADTARQIGEALLGLAGRGRTVIVVSHDAAVIERAERVIRLERGRIVSDLGRTASASARQGAAP